MKNTIIVTLFFAFVIFLGVQFSIGKARMAIEIQNEKQFCIDKGFTDLQVCREWWITAGDPSRKR